MSKKKELVNWQFFSNTIILVSIVIVSIFYIYLSTHNEIVGLVADDAIYLLMADYFSPYFQALSKSAAFVMQTSQFPPLYPLLLALLGASSSSLIFAHFITTCFFIISAIFYYYWSSTVNNDNSIGKYLVLIYICLPASLILNIDLWSEHLYLALTLLSLFLIEKARFNEKYFLIASIIIGLIPLTRLVGLTFIIAYFIYLHFSKVKNKYCYFLISIFPFIIWKLISTSFYHSEIYHDTVTSFYRYDLWTHIKYLFNTQLVNLWYGWHECFDIRKNLFSSFVCGSVLIMALVTWTKRLKKKAIDSLYLLFYFLIIWVWPDENHNMRFVFPIFPILLCYSYMSLCVVLERDFSSYLKLFIKTSSMIIILVTFLPTNLYAANRLLKNIPQELAAYKNTKYWLIVDNKVEFIESVRIMDKMMLSYVLAGSHVPKDECVYTAHQESFMYYARRLAFPLPLPNDLSKSDNRENLNKCDYVHILHTNSHPKFPGGYPLNFIKNNSDVLMKTKLSDKSNSPVIAELFKLNS